MGRGNVLIGQSGGPTAVINASLVGVVEAARVSRKMGRVFGMRFGIEGVLGDFLLDLSAEPLATLKALRATPSSALGSSRHKLKDPDFGPIMERLKKYDIRYLFMIGGNDTMDTVHRITEHAAGVGYEMTGVGIPKTVDNDLFGVDHTPGYPSAARYVALSVQQGGLLARDMQRVDPFTVFQTVGRSAGWLPAAAALAKRKPEDPPHIILMPERPFDQQSSSPRGERVQEVRLRLDRLRRRHHARRLARPVSASTVTDKFSNVEFGAMGGTSAAMMLHRMLSNTFGWRGEFQVTESLQMSAADRAGEARHRRGLRLRSPGRETRRARRRRRDGHHRTRQQARPRLQGIVRHDPAEEGRHQRPADGRQIHRQGRHERDEGVLRLRRAAGGRIAGVSRR
jgi:6-phosphofructokinase 1